VLLNGFIRDSTILGDLGCWFFTDQFLQYLGRWPNYLGGENVLAVSDLTPQELICVAPDQEKATRKRDRHEWYLSN